MPIKSSFQCCLALMLFVFSTTVSIGQTVEICNDGIDNDGNGLIDCADSFCNFAVNIEKGCHCFDNIDNDGDGLIDKADPNCAAYYGLTFIGEGSTCSITPPGANTPFDLVSAPSAVSGQNTSDTQSKVAVGDIDGDGIPDVAITSKFNSNLRIVATSGTNSNPQPDGSKAGDVKSEYNINGSPIIPYNSKFMYEHDVLIADINKNGKAEIFGIISDRPPQGSSVAATRFFLVGFKYAKNSLIPLFNAVDLGPDRPGIPGIADFDGDGKAEIYLKDEIYAAESGVKLADGGGIWDTEVNAAPVAVNIFPATPNMELVTGKYIYTVPNLSSRTLQPLTIAADMSSIQPYFPKTYNDLTEYGIDNASSTSVADMDEDGFLDVLLSGSTTASGTAQKTAVFYWNVQKNKVSVFFPPDATLANGWTWGTSRINLGDANGDGKPDASFIAGNRLFCLTTDAGDNLVSLWGGPRTVNDSNSGIVAVTIYDFNNDGQPEMVYRDSQEIVVIDGATGQSKLWSAACQSHTFTEGPIIADVNGDGGTDICVPCFRGPGSFNINGTLQEQARGEVRLWYSTGNEWLPTRKVWNQPGYFVVNVNDNLTLPFPQLDQMLSFGNTPCPNGIPGPNQPFNVFLNQVPKLSAEGCPVFPAPDLSYFGDDPANPGVDIDGDGVYTPAVEVTPPICGNLDITVAFNIVNSGDLPISDTTPVAFFNGDPLNGGTYLHNATLNISNLQVGQTLHTPDITFNGPGTVFTLYIVLYSDGTLPLTINSTKECSIANNTYSVLITPDPFTVTVEKLSDNFKCDNSAPDNGELRAHIFKGGVEVFDYSPFAFQWYNGSDTSSPIAGPEGTAYNLTDIPEGDYSLIVTNTQKGCISDLVSQDLVRLGNDPDITINVLSDQTQCSPANGKLEAVIAGGNTGFTFEWFDISLNPLGITGPIANNLVAGNYLVRVSKDGCIKVSDPATVNGPQIPDAQAQVIQHVVDCDNLNSGIILADALFNGVVQDPSLYQFDWYFYDNATSTRGSILPPANGTGQTRTGLAVGFYQAVIKQINTQCVSAQSPIVEVLDLRVIPTAVISELAPQTSCDPSNPNGILKADAYIGGVLQNPADFTFEWFKGDNTLPGSLHTTVSGVNGQQADKISGGGEYYTVKITTSNHCFDTEKLIITEDVNVPVVTLSVSPNAICDPAKASSNYNGSVTATVTFAGNPVADFSNYKFTWHQGPLTSDPVIPVPDDKSPTLDQLNGGYYTVTVQRLDLSCTSVPVVGEVINMPVPPAISNISVPSTNCSGGAPNGILDAQVDLGGGSMTTTGYTFTWYQGNGTGGVVVGNTATIPNQQGGSNFTVEVVNNATGCSNTLTLLLPDNSALPVLTLTPSPNSICDPLIGFNGSIATSVNDVNSIPAHTYNFVWSTGTDLTSPIAGQNAASLNGRNGDFYTATVTNVTLNCTSAPVITEIKNEQILPVINTALIPSTNCVGGTPNGSIDSSVDVGGTPTTGGYTFNWFTGNLTSDPPVPASPNNGNTFNPIQLQGGQNFTVEVRNDASGCTNTKSITLPDNKELPILTLTPSPNAICDPLIGFDGSIASGLTDTNGLPGHTYTYVWSTGTDLTSPIGGQTGSSLANQNGDFYTATVTNVTLNCTSSPVTTEIQNNQIFPAITTSITGSSNCAGGAPDGIASVTGVLPADTYEYRWYQGVVVNPGAELNPVVNPTISGLQGGATENYIVEVKLQSTGCTNTEGVLIPDISEVPVLGPLSKVDNTLCVGSNGQAIIGTVDYRGAIASPYTGYTLAWSNGGNTPTIGALAQGNYSLTITKDDVNCTSNPVSIDVNDNLFIPVIDVAAVVQTSCVNPKNGELAATIDETLIGGGAGTTAGYNFVWYDGSDLTSPTAAGKYSGTPGEIVTLDGNVFYTVEVTRPATGCTNTKTTFLQEIITIPTVTLNVASQQTACLPPDGQIDAIVNPAPVLDYTFYWLKEQPNQFTNDASVLIGDVNGSPAAPNRKFNAAVGATTDSHNQLTFGNYTMLVVDEVTQCVSQPQTATILDQTASDITFGIGALPTSCALSNGILDIQAQRVDGMATQFTFEVFIEGPTNTTSPIAFPDNPPVFDAGLNPPSGTTSPFPTLGPVANNVNVIQGSLFSSTYSVIATDASGCKNFDTFFLPFQDAHDVDVVVNNSQICPYTVGDGSISIQTIAPPTTPGANQTQFTYSFYAGGVANPANLLSPPPANPFNYAPSTEVCNDGIDNDGDGLIDGADPDCSNRVDKLSLAPGFYTVEVQENISGASCKVKKVIEIGRDALPPLLDLVSFTPNTACDVVTSPDGAAEISIAKDSDDNTVGSTYTLGVFPATGTETFTAALGPLPFANPVITGLKPSGNVPQYTLTVTSSNNCVNERFVTIPDQPTTAELVGGDVLVSNAEYCNPLLEQSAKVVVNNVRVVGGGVEIIADYQFDWFTDIGLTTNVFAAAQGNPAAATGGDEFINNVPPGSGTVPAGTVKQGSYWVKVTKTADASGTGGVGCFSAPIKVDIVNHFVNPQVTLTPFSNTACDGNFEGRIVVDAVTPAAFGPPDLSPGNGATYAYNWTSSVVPPANTVGESGIANSTPTNLQDGDYILTAMNEVTGCATVAMTKILKVSPPVFTMNVSSTPQQLCSPDGTAIVNDVLVSGVSDGIANFDFNWFRGAPNTIALVDGGAATITANQIDNTNYLTIGDDTYYVVATRRPNTDPGSGCSSAPVQVKIDDTSVDPVIALTPFFNTACDTGFEGRITTAASTQVGTPGELASYIYNWVSTSTTTPAANPTAVGNESFLNLEDGDYTLTITNNITQCQSAATASIVKSLTPIVVASATPTDQQLCSPDGSILVNDVTVNGAIDPNHNNFDFIWFKDSPANPPLASGFNNDFFDIADFATIGVGTYYVKAKRGNGIVPGSGCESAPLRVEIKDTSVDPILSFSTLANTSCDANFDGQITVNVSTSSGPGVASNYDLVWTSVPVGSAVANALNTGSPYSTGGADMVGPGTFQVQATNLTTQCLANGSVIMITTPQPLDILTVNKTDQNICFPDGSVTVSTLNSGAVGNYTYEWFRNDPTSAALVDAGSAVITTPTLDVANYPTIGADTYYVVATKNAGVTPGSGCKTPPFRVDLLDLHKDPRLQFAFTPNSSCDLLNPNGSVLADAAEQSGVNTDTYSFTWTYNGGGLPGVTVPANTNNSSLLGPAFEGNYVLTIVNTTTTGCSFTSGLDVNLDLTISLPNIIDATTVDPLDCLASGSATVTRVGIGGVTFYNDPPDDLDLNFDYKWFKGDLSNQLGGEVNHNIVNYLPDKYYVSVIDGATKCESGPKEVVINDDQIVYPDVQITQTARQISCMTATGTAALAATADGQTDADPNYNFSWFNTLDATGLSFTNTSTITNQLAGDYSVTALNVTTGCSSFAPYIVPEEAPQFTPVVSVGGQPRTLCVGQDGSVLARVIDINPAYPFPLNYTSDLYFGSQSNPVGPPDVPNMGLVPGFNVNFVEEGLPEGLYTVRLTDNNTGCTSLAIAEVLDQRIPPSIAIVQENPLTNCDPAIANGQLSATANNGKVGGYSFNWFAGTAVASPPGAVLSSLNKLIAGGAGEYVVRVTNKVTGCFADMTGFIVDMTITPPIPTAITLQNRTNCIDPNGWVTATVSGVTFNYDFNWYDGAAASGGIDFTGVDYRNVDIGDYTVTATDQITRCISPPATTSVLDDRLIPEFVFNTTPSFCQDTGRPQGTGSIILTVTNTDETNISLSDVQWVETLNDQPVGNGTAIYDLFPGFYRAKAITNEGCTNEGIAEVKTEISPYNGISSNRDGQNDVFIVDCISLFPNNNVKIFNRNGIKVYEVNGYNNADVSFNGIGLDGLYLSGKELPVGTYFYVIDKRDGSKPIAGYLELDR